MEEERKEERKEEDEGRISVATLRNSAPVAFGHRRAIGSKRILGSTAIERAWMRRMCARPSWSGALNSILRSMRPGRRSAGSSVSGLRARGSRRVRRVRGEGRGG